MAERIAIPSKTVKLIRYGEMLITEEVMNIIIETRKQNNLPLPVLKFGKHKPLLVIENDLVY